MLMPILAAAAAAAPITLPPPAELRAQIEERDAKLFKVLFGLDCRPELMAELVADDLEFYYDKDGAAFGGKTMVDTFMRICRERSQPNAWRSRRELVATSLTVDPVPGLGAIEAGEHLFYERRGEGAEKLAGRARFANLWRLTAAGWRLARVFSYSHGPAR